MSAILSFLLLRQTVFLYSAWHMRLPNARLCAHAVFLVSPHRLACDVLPLCQASFGADAEPCNNFVYFVDKVAEHMVRGIALGAIALNEALEVAQAAE